MKKVCCFWIATFICIVLVGCSRDFNKKDMNQIDMIRLVGLDYEGGEFIITAMYGIGGTDTIVDEIRTIEGRGSDIFTAFEDLRSKNSKSISLSYTGFYMVGEGLAENGVTELIDYLMRDESIKVNALVFLVKDFNAKEIIKGAEENKVMIQDNLDAMVRKRLETIKKNENTVLSLYNQYKNNEGSCLIPYLTYLEENLSIGGYAGLREGKLVNYFDSDASIGADILRNNAKSINAVLGQGIFVTMNNIKVIKDCNLNTDSIEVFYRVQFTSVLRGVNNNQSGLDTQMKKKIEDKQNTYMRQLLQAVTVTTNQTNIDAIGLLELFREKDEIWNALEDHQDDFLKYLTYSYTVTSRLVRSNVLEGGY